MINASAHTERIPPFFSITMSLLALMAALGASKRFQTIPIHSFVKPVVHLLPHSRVNCTSYDAVIQKAARDNGLDPLLIKAVIAAESQFDVHEVSPAGACGLMQLMPGTARMFAVTDIFDPEQNVQAGAKHLRHLLNRFSNNLTLSLAAYNAGERPVLAYKGIPPYPETQHYVFQVLQIYRAYQS